MNARTPRKFNGAPAVREAQRAFLSFSSPSGGGKTQSSLEMACGLLAPPEDAGELIGTIFGVDTENARMKKYAPPPNALPSPWWAKPEGKTYAFTHVDFQPKFDPDSYLDALRWCEEQAGGRPGVVIFDSMSHEHAGEGGRLDSAAKISGGDPKKAFGSWRQNSEGRNRLLWSGFFRSPLHIILCFRCKDKVEKRGSDIVDMGFSPIGGEDFIFEADASILFMPQAKGVPTWKSELRGERAAMKLPGEFRGILDDGAPISFRHGRRIAQWLNAGGTLARGATSSRPVSSSPSVVASPNVTTTEAGAGMSPLAPAPLSQTFPGDFIEYEGDRYDPADPKPVKPRVKLRDMEPRELANWSTALSRLISAAPAYAKRAWYETNTPEILELSSLKPAWAGKLNDISKQDSAVGSPPSADGGALGSGAGDERAADYVEAR